MTPHRGCVGLPRTAGRCRPSARRPRCRGCDSVRGDSRALAGAVPAAAGAGGSIVPRAAALLSMVNSAARTPRPGPGTAGAEGGARSGQGFARLRGWRALSVQSCEWCRLPPPPARRTSPDPFASAGGRGRRSYPRRALGTKSAPGSTARQSPRPGAPHPRAWRAVGRAGGRASTGIEGPWGAAREAGHRCTRVVLSVRGTRPAAGRVLKRLLKTGASKMPSA